MQNCIIYSQIIINKNENMWGYCSKYELCRYLDHIIRTKYMRKRDCWFKLATNKEVLRNIQIG